MLELNTLRRCGDSARHVPRAFAHGPRSMSNLKECERDGRHRQRAQRGTDRRGAGALLTVMTWTAVLSPAGNPFMDDHLVDAATLVALALFGRGQNSGVGPEVGRDPVGSAHALAEGEPTEVDVVPVRGSESSPRTGPGNPRRVAHHPARHR